MISNIKISNLEKLMGSQYAIILIASVVFLDCYLLLRYNINIVTVDNNWIRKHSNFHEAIELLIAFSITFGILIPIISTLVRELLSAFNSFLDETDFIFHKKWGSNSYQLKIDNYIEKEKFRDWAIKTSNYAAYQEYQIFIKSYADNEFFEYMCRTIIILSLISLIFSTLAYPSLIHIVKINIYNLPWYARFPLKLIELILEVCIVIKGFFPDDLGLRNYIRLDNHKIK